MWLKWWRQPQLHLREHSAPSLPPPPQAFPFALLPLYRAISFTEKDTGKALLTIPELFID